MLTKVNKSKLINIINFVKESWKYEGCISTFNSKWFNWDSSVEHTELKTEEKFNKKSIYYTNYNLSIVYTSDANKNYKIACAYSIASIFTEKEFLQVLVDLIAERIEVKDKKKYLDELTIEFTFAIRDDKLNTQLDKILTILNKTK